ncbi:Myb-like protein L [Hordeum vulgare]|nr:Myb-like protein L [Hordeum vulgare]
MVDAEQGCGWSTVEETEPMVVNGTCVGAWIELYLQRQGEAELGKVKTDAMAAQGVVQADVTSAGSAMAAQTQRRLRVKMDPRRARRGDCGTDEGSSHAMVVGSGRGLTSPQLEDVRPMRKTKEHKENTEHFVDVVPWHLNQRANQVLFFSFEVCTNEYKYKGERIKGATLIPERKRVGRWSDDEDKRLLVSVKIFRSGNWNKIAQFVSSRNQSQCSERWCNVLDSDIDYGEWCPQEDSKLLASVHEILHDVILMVLLETSS